MQYVLIVIYFILSINRTSLVAQLVKNPPAMQETWVRSLGWEGPLEEGMATHSSILAWRIPWTEKPGGIQSTGLQRVGHNRATKPKSTVCIWQSQSSNSSHHPHPPWYPYICSPCLYFSFCFASKIIYMIFLMAQTVKNHTEI